MKKRYPHVVLIGRTNVGKSTLFNRIARRTESIVEDQDGVTRDYLSENITLHGKTFTLIDTGGFAYHNEEDPFAPIITERSKEACESADVILFVCDGKNGITDEDRRVARALHKIKVPTLLTLTKCDNKNKFAENEYDFISLGFPESYPVSGTHGTGVNKLLEAVTELLPAYTKQPVEAPDLKITLLGKPNVGKSSLMNILVEHQRSIVADIPGTTREAVSERITFQGQDIMVTDTAGVRKKRRVTDDLESMMVKSSLAAVRSTDIILFMVDGSAGRITDQELKLLFYSFEEQHKALILLRNKSDLFTQEILDRAAYEDEQYDFFLKKIPTISLSCKTGDNCGKIFREIEKIQERLKLAIPSADLYETVLETFRRKPLFHNKQKLLIYSIVQQHRDSHRGALTFELTVNYPEWFDQSACSAIENILRKKYDMRGCPLVFFLKKKKIYD